MDCHAMVPICIPRCTRTNRWLPAGWFFSTLAGRSDLLIITPVAVVQIVTSRLTFSNQIISGFARFCRHVKPKRSALSSSTKGSFPLSRMKTNHHPFSLPPNRAVTDPRDGRRVALKKLPNVFQSLVSSKRVFRELKMLCFFKHDNVSTTMNYMHLQCTTVDWDDDTVYKYFPENLLLLKMHSKNSLCSWPHCSNNINYRFQ